MPTFNKTDMMDCAAGHHDFSDGRECRVCACSEQIHDDANDTVDALVQAEAFIRGFEDDELQEGIPDLLAGLRAAIVRERARPDLLAALQMAIPVLEWCDKQWANSPQHGDGINVLDVVRAFVAKAEGRTNG